MINSMSFDFDAPRTSLTPPKQDAKTVTEISQEIKRLVENTFNKVYVKGEIFGAKRADSGHWYLSLKDENSVKPHYINGLNKESIKQLAYYREKKILKVKLLFNTKFKGKIFKIKLAN